VATHKIDTTPGYDHGAPLSILPLGIGEAVKTVLFNCSQYVQRITRPALEDAKCGIPAPEQLIGCTEVNKTMMKHEFFHQLASVRIEDLDVFQSLKSKFTADTIDIPTLKFNLSQVYLICRGDRLFDAVEELIDFMTQMKGKAILKTIESDYNHAVADSSPIVIPVETNFSNQNVLRVKKFDK